MPETPDLDTMQDQIFDLVKRSQDALVGAGRAFAESVSNVVPADTSAIDDLIDRAFDLTAKVLDAQREFAKNVVKTVTRQIAPGDGD
ncbi:MAG: hypothetical protein N2037_03225 [Acidimicrobiales bacterium]|nr:hypothetical protein [Acidimicrobiales bacterium]